MSARTVLRLLALVLALWPVRPLFAAGARDESPATFAAVQRAIRELRYDDARAELDQSLRRGHYGREQLVALYALRGEVAAVLDGPAVAEAEFRKLLVLMPEHGPPSRATPVMNLPFQQARRWVNEHGHLTAEERILGTPRENLPTTVAVALTSDPLAMVARARLFYRENAAEPFAVAGETTLRQTLPALSPGGSCEYNLELLDAADDVVLRLGTSDTPLTIELPRAEVARAERAPLQREPAARLPLLEVRRMPAPDRPRVRPLAIAGFTIAGFGALSLASGIGVDVDGRQQYDGLVRSCAPGCSNASIAQLHQYESAAIGLYTTAGLTLAASAALLLVDHFRR